MAFNLKRVLISDEVAPKCVEILQTNGIEVLKNTKLTKEQLLSEIPKYDGLIVRSATKVTSDVIEAGTRLKIIGRAGTGVDNIDCNAATKRGVIVMNTPGGNTLSAAEHTCSMIMAVSRHIPQGHETMRQGKWDRKKFMGNEVYGKTLAIIGLGRIGKEVATRMQAFGMTTIGYDPIIPAEVSATFDTEWMPLDDLWPKADYITVHTPLIPQTRNLINLEVLKKCKKNVRLINVARGGIIDEEGLLQALEQGFCGGAALDVFVEEPPTNTKLTQHPLIVCTPHLGASTVEAQARVAEEIAEQFVAGVQGKSLFGAINAQAMTNALSADTKPWVQCGTAMGAVLATMSGSGMNSNTKVKVISQGPGLDKSGSYLGAAVLAGLLRLQCNGFLNLVNAPVFAKEMGIEITTEYKEAASQLVQVIVQQDGSPVCNKVSGFASNNSSMLTEMNSGQYVQPVCLAGNLLIYQAQANPQVMPAVAGALAGEDCTPMSFASSSPVNGQAWNVMHLSVPLKNPDILKLHVTGLYQLTL
ncbi:D-3-phosphoglycerate dehydrogenase-like [Lineus longissimus]|uniref:D-3-phosphoglycerate dehydrogenase-like n=1 Tax=Lineus longissimus TaxID=88925 RepID=UPI002B4F5CAE